MKRVEKKKFLGPHNKNITLKIALKIMQKQPREKFCKKAVLKNFAIFTGKYMCWRLSLIQSIAKFFRAPILKNICEWPLLNMFMKLRS